jgi:predicted RNase H-like HicB family nuclease
MKYEIIMFWSDEDEAFICEVPELAGCMAHGNTQEIALQNIQEAIDLWIETALEFGDFIPKPKGKKLMYA